MPFADGLATLRSYFVGILCIGVVLPLVLAVPSQAQDSSPSRRQKATHFSLYWENYKNDNFKQARPDLLWMLKNAPGFDDGSDKHFIRVVKLYRGLAEQASSEDERMAYLDTAATYLATAVDTLEKNGLGYSASAWEIRKGRFLESYEGSLPEDIALTEEPVAYYKRAFELDPQNPDPYYIRQILQSYVQNNELNQALEFANTIEQERGDEKKVAQMVQSVRKNIFAKNPQARISHLEAQLEQAPDSTQLMAKLFNAYINRGNVTRASELATRLMESNPPAEVVRQVAEMRLEDGRPEEALQAYDRAQQQGAELSTMDYFNRGEAYAEMNNFTAARQEYRQALELDPEFGRAYIAIGDLYTQAVSQCSGGSLGRDDKAVYWLAVDKYRRAKQVDPSVASTADSKINTFRKYFPTQEDIFYRNSWEEGARVTINSGCYSWINESTTVRQATS